MGNSPAVNTFFGITTMLIAIPTGVKVFDWLFTMYRGRIRFTTPMYWTMGFLTTFVFGGMTGVLMALPPADYVVHNSLFLIAHFHNMLIPGALFGYFAGYSVLVPQGGRLPSGREVGEAGLLVLDHWLRIWPSLPLYILGFMGMPRRMEHYWNLAWQPYLIVAACGAAVICHGHRTAGGSISGEHSQPPCQP